MFDNRFHIVWLVGMVIYWFFVWGPARRRLRRQKVEAFHSRPGDVILDFLGAAAWQILPLFAIFSPWLRFADFSLPLWAGVLGGVMQYAAIGLIWRAYHDLGKNWSPRIEVTQQQALVTSGVYQYLRHPVYTGMLLWALAQPLLIQNWIAGWAMLVIMVILFVVRIPHEERMMIEHFGDEYRAYMSRTGGLIPRAHSR